jgi:membrane-anchored protein YejM (alkaline phosphatase superfamily)
MALPPYNRQIKYFFDVVYGPHNVILYSVPLALQGELFLMLAESALGCFDFQIYHPALVVRYPVGDASVCAHALKYGVIEYIMQA